MDKELIQKFLDNKILESSIRESKNLRGLLVFGRLNLEYRNSIGVRIYNLLRSGNLEERKKELKKLIKDEQEEKIIIFPQVMKVIYDYVLEAFNLEDNSNVIRNFLKNPFEHSILNSYPSDFSTIVKFSEERPRTIFNAMQVFHKISNEVLEHNYQWGYLDSVLKGNQLVPSYFLQEVLNLIKKLNGKLEKNSK